MPPLTLLTHDGGAVSSTGGKHVVSGAVSVKA
jgi:hypothetical protein